MEAGTVYTLRVNAHARVAMYASATDYVNAALAAPVTTSGIVERESHVSAMKCEPSFYGGTFTLEDVATKARLGVNPKFSKAAALAASMTKAPANMPRVTYSMAGGAVNVPRVLSGHPECMRRVKRAKRDVRSVRFVVNLSASCMVNASALEARGQAIVNTAHALTLAGTPIEVWAIEPNECGGEVLSSCILLKRADAPINWQTMAFWLGSPLALRGMVFAHQDACMTEEERAPRRYGRGQPVSFAKIGGTIPGRSGPCVVVDQTLSNEGARSITERRIAEAVADARRNNSTVTIAQR